MTPLAACHLQPFQAPDPPPSVVHPLSPQQPGARALGQALVTLTGIRATAPYQDPQHSAQPLRLYLCTALLPPRLEAESCCSLRTAYLRITGWLGIRGLSAYSHSSVSHLQPGSLSLDLMWGHWLLWRHPSGSRGDGREGLSRPRLSTSPRLLLTAYQATSCNQNPPATSAHQTSESV